MPYYKFLKETDRKKHTVLKSSLEGNLKFSLFESMDDKTETVVDIDNENIKTTIERIQQEGVCSKDIENIHNQSKLINQIYSKKNDFAKMVVRDFLSQMKKKGQDSHDNFMGLIQSLLSSSIKTTNKDIQKRIGILCITKEIKNKQMWEDYTDNAKGFVVEYNDLESVFTGDGTGVFDEIKKINYVDEEKDHL